MTRISILSMSFGVLLRWMLFWTVLSIGIVCVFGLTMDLRRLLRLFISWKRGTR